MIDLGTIPRTIQNAVSLACRVVEEDLEAMSQETLIDTASEMTLRQWANTLDIFTEISDVENLREEIKVRLSANGSVNVKWFYTLAERLGFIPDKSAVVEFEPDNSDPVRIDWGASPGDQPRVHICDGHFLPFRAGISRTGDVAYDNERWGATTVCVIFDASTTLSDRRVRNALVSLMLLAKNMGTVILFYEDGRLL